MEHAGNDSVFSTKLTKSKLLLDETFLNFVLNLVPENLIEAGFQQTDLVIEDTKITISKLGGANLFGLLIFSIIFGLALQSIGETAMPVVGFFNGSRQALVWMVSVLIWYFPVGIASLIASRISETTNLVSALMQVSMYVCTMICSLVVHNLVMVVVFYLLTRNSPCKLISDMVPAFTCAVGTASSAATMPITLRCLSASSIMDVKVVRFILPFGTTINMSGTAILEAVGPIFLAQTLRRNIGVQDSLLVVFSAALAAMVTGSLPSGGIITMFITLDALDIPTETISILMPVDWFLDRIRTPTNIFGNAFATGVVSHFVKEKCEKLSQKVSVQTLPSAEIDLETAEQGSCTRTLTNSNFTNGSCSQMFLMDELQETSKGGCTEEIVMRF